MNGNVFEWCWDWFDEEYYKSSPIDDPQGPSKGLGRVLRGGSGIRDADYCRSALRLGSVPELLHLSNKGFRVAAVPPFTQENAATAQKELSQSLGTPVEMTNSIGMRLKLMPAGEFMMGSPEPDNPAMSHGSPQHKVRITKPFYLGVYEVTQAEYARVMGENPSRFKGASNPVEQVSWDDATEFCKKLSAKEGKTYRLPTEAEWEYACRAGTTTEYSFGNDAASLGEYAWFEGNSERKTHPVGQKKPNAWGLFDMHGNVGEWTRSAYLPYPFRRDDPRHSDPTVRRVVRGGSWYDRADLARSGCRTSYWPWQRVFDVGFRVVCELE